jgi:Transglutaminase-like superfamily
MQLNTPLRTISSLSRRAKWRLLLISVERSRLVIESWLLLFFFELVMKFRSSEALREAVHNESVRCIRSSGLFTSEKLSRAIDLACVFYFKKVLCLQRSAATTILLRRYGLNAEMVTGAQIIPLEFHAWVEVGGVVINDRPYVNEIYHVLERC